MPFGPPKVTIGKLNSATPTALTPDLMKQQLANIGLSCAMLEKENISQYIDNVTDQLPDGNVQSTSIKAPTPPQSPTMSAAIVNATSLAATLPNYQEVATGNWSVDPTGLAEGFNNIFEVIQYPTHFQWLYDNRATTGFAGTTDSPPTYSGNEANAAAIQTLFVNTGVSASSTLVSGLDKSSMIAALTNAIAPLTDQNLSNYSNTDSRVIFLVENYNASDQTAEGIGFVTVDWTLNITDYKRKTKDGGDTHPTSLVVTARSALYTDASIICRDYNAVLTQFGIDKTTAPQCPPPGT